jgi:hypothetical protein
MIEWLQIFAQPFIRSTPPSDRADFLAEIRAALGPALLDGSGAWIIDYVRLRFSASKPEC